ncbi:AbrB family transcriptional regulator [Mycobacterium hubeiense]|uniref:AbrB family transcriptional regulator n=1 Tax=Mycobacterium hubeiense TaxID=1867256 RepID=UPI000C7ECAF3|nr:AbrB family transcriptional regulator [Mycobacterium sp. QGD 101]
MGRWALLIAVTVVVTIPLTRVGVPSAALFAGLLVGIVLALLSLAPKGIPHPIGTTAQGMLGVYIGTMVQPDAVDALGAEWPIVVAVAVGTLLISIVAGALLGLHRDVTPLTGSLALVAGGASGLVSIARELGGDDRVVSVVQYLRVALVTASLPLVAAVVYHADRAHDAVATPETVTAPWYLSIAIMVGLIAIGAAGGRLIRLPGAGLLGPLALTVALELTGLSFGLAVPVVLVQIAYMVIGWQAGVVFTREAVQVIWRIMPAALALIAALTVAIGGLGALLAHFAGLTPLEGYLATTPGGVYAVLAMAVETGSNVTFVIAAQVLRVLLMLFAAPLVARVVLRLTGQSRAITEPSREPIRVAD